MYHIFVSFLLCGSIMQEMKLFLVHFEVICASKVLCCGLVNDESLSQSKQGVDLYNSGSRVSKVVGFLYIIKGYSTIILNPTILRTK